jgi:hypothetical protein
VDDDRVPAKSWTVAKRASALDESRQRRWRADGPDRAIASRQKRERRG